MKATYLVGGGEVPDEEEDAHDDVLRDRDDVGASDLEHLDAFLRRGVEVNMVGPYTSSDTNLEVLRINDYGVIS